MGFGFRDSVFHFAVDIFDRVTGTTQISGRDNLLLSAVTSLWVAAKIEDTAVPTLENLEFLTKDLCKREQIVECELRILTTLSFSLARETVFSQLQLFEKPNLPEEVKLMNNFLSVLAVFIPDFVCINPNLIVFCVLRITSLNYNLSVRSLMRREARNLEFDEEKCVSVTKAICNVALQTEQMKPVHEAFSGMCEARDSPVPHLNTTMLRNLIAN
jgi:hypothetical protein